MSGEAVPYHLRQNKHVDRQLFVEILSHVNRSIPIAKAFYVSFGGVYFEDFKLIHQIFGAKKLLSVEKHQWVLDRQKHNRPYGCIRCKLMTSRQLVNSINEIREQYRGPLVCWLDFAEAAKRRGQLEDVEILSKSVRDGDVLRVTMNANPASLGAQFPGESNDECDARRLVQLKDSFSDKVTRDAEIADVSRQGFPNFCLEMIRRSIHVGLKSNPALVFQPLGSYTYADSDHTMLTVTGIFLNHKRVDEFLKRSQLKEFELAGLEWQTLHINVPLLSQREKLTLDQKFGTRQSPSQVAAKLKFQVDQKSEVSVEMLKSYFTFHRYYPHFHRIQY